MEFPSKSTIKYTAERGTDDYPEEPSRLILVESDTAAGNVISCDEGCICNSVNDSVLGCGLIAKPTEVQYKPIEDAGHGVVFQKYAIVNSLIIDFLKQTTLE